MTTTLHPTQATAVITLDDARAWLAEHGIDANQVCECRIRIASMGSSIGAWVDIEFYKRNLAGQIEADIAGEEAITGQVSVPLRSWPRLTQPDQEVSSC